MVILRFIATRWKTPALSTQNLIRSALSNPSGLLSQKLFHYLTSTAHWMTYLWEPHIEWLTLILANRIYHKLMYWKRPNPNCHSRRRNKVALRTTCIKNVKFKIIKIRTGCEYVGYFYHSENLNWATKNFDWATCWLRVGHSWIRWIKLNFMNKIINTKFSRIFIELIIYRQLTLWGPQVAGCSLGSWGPRLKPTQPIGKFAPAVLVSAEF